jgi:UDPglucose 6-dehydrogenase
VIVVGLGKLGLPLATLLAEVGHSVIGVDKSENLINSLNTGAFKSTEPGLEDSVRKAKERSVLFQVRVPHKPRIDELVFVVVPTPSDESGRFSNSLVMEALNDLAPLITDRNNRVIINIVSTIMPGSSKKELIPLIESKTGKVYPKDFGFAYNPEFIALGSVLRDMQSPDMHLIGCEVSADAQILQEVLESIALEKVPERVMSLPEAEITKIAINNFITTKISFANMLFQASLKMPGTNVDVISGALGLDSRIGPKYIKGGAPYGGPCFPRDTRALAVFLEDLGVNPGIPRATDLANKGHAMALANEAMSRAPVDNARILLMGISYKAFSQVTDDSPALAIGYYLSQIGAEVHYWDPDAAVTASMELINTVSTSDLDSFLDSCDLVVVTRPLVDSPEVVAKLRGSLLVFNLWER